MIVHGYRADVWFINGLPMEAYIAHKFSSLLSMRKIKTLRKVVGDWAWERGRNLKLTEDSFDDFQKNKHSLHLEIAKFSRGWTAKKVNKVIDKWLIGYDHLMPSDFFEKHPTKDPWLVCNT